MSEKYLYRTRRIGDRVRRTHLGKTSDRWVEMIGRLRAFCRNSRKAWLTQRRGEMEQSRAGETVTKRLARLVDYWPVLNVCSELLGPFDLPESQQSPKSPFMSTETEPFDMLPKRNELSRLIRSADAGDSEAQNQLSALLKQFPQIVADMASFVEIAKRTVVDSASRCVVSTPSTPMKCWSKLSTSSNCEGSHRAFAITGQTHSNLP